MSLPAPLLTTDRRLAGAPAIDAYIELKMTEVNRIRVQVNPAEYDMYYSL